MCIIKERDILSNNQNTAERSSLYAIYSVDVLVVLGGELAF